MTPCEQSRCPQPGRPKLGLLLVLVVAGFAAWPPAVALFEEGVQGAFKYFASDSFYYLAIADQSSVAGYYTFDGLNPTNGFHPLWEFYLHQSFAALALAPEQQIMFTAVSSVVFSSLGAALLAWTVFRLTGHFAVALLAAVPGLFFLVMPHFGKNFAAQWNFSNGMESPLSVLIFGLVLVFLFSGQRTRRVWSRRDLALLSLPLTALVLTRLDDVFILVPFSLYALASGRSIRDRMARGISVLVVPVAVLTLYMGFNFGYSGSFLPSSGLAKADPLWAILRNGYAVFTTFFPFLDFMRADVAVWKSEGWRVIQMTFPAALAIFWLVRLRHGRKAGPAALSQLPGVNTAVGCLAVYVILKAAYNFSVVGLWHQGGWYYVVSIMTCNLILALLVADLLERARKLRPLASESSFLCRHEALLSSVAAVLLVLLIGNAATEAKRSGRDHDRNYRFWAQRVEAQDLIDEHCHACGVVSYDDGIVAYALDRVPTLNGLGLVLDEEAAAARGEGRLLELAWARGHRLLVTVNYPMAPDAYDRPSALRSHLERNGHFASESLDQWHFEVAFGLPDSNVKFIHFAPASLVSVESEESLAGRQTSTRPDPAPLELTFGS